MPAASRGRIMFDDMREPAFAVVGEYHRVVALDELREVGELASANVSWLGGFSKSTRSSCWCGRSRAASPSCSRPDRVCRLRGRSARGAAVRSSERPGSSSPTTDNEARARFAERCGVARDVRRAAGALFVALDLHHRHRRLRRNAADFAEPVAVEHDVADDEYARRAQHGQRSGTCPCAARSRLVLPYQARRSLRRVSGRLPSLDRPIAGGISRVESLERRKRIGRARDRPADHEVIGTGRDGRAGVITRCWSSDAPPAGRMPGVTRQKSLPHSRSSDAASRAEHTTPSSPARLRELREAHDDCGRSCRRRRPR